MARVRMIRRHSEDKPGGGKALYPAPGKYCQVSDEVAERLVNCGAAKLVDEPKQKEAAKPKPVAAKKAAEKKEG